VRLCCGSGARRSDRRYASLNWIFVLDAATSVVAVSLVAGVSLRPAERRDGRTSAWREFKGGFRFAYTTRSLCLYLGIFTALWLSFGAFGALEPLFYRDILKTGPEALGWVNMLFGAGVVGGSVLLGRLPSAFVSARSALLGAAASGLGAVIYTGTADMRVVLAGAVSWGVLLGVMFPMVRTLIQGDTPDHLTGRVMGTTNISNHIGELTPLTFAPMLASTL
jgi:DHA3 family macrolide efflux protein-like MFS transporter